jgi:hypothetical protein
MSCFFEEPALLTILNFFFVVEVCLHPQSTAEYQHIEYLVANTLLEQYPIIVGNGPLDLTFNDYLRIHVKSAKVSDLGIKDEILYC